MTRNFLNEATEVIKNAGTDLNSDISVSSKFSGELFSDWSKLCQPGSSYAPLLPQLRLLSDGKIIDHETQPEWVVPIGAHGNTKNSVKLIPIDKPEQMPDVWNQPRATRMDGKCGITANSNLLRLYGIEKSPSSLDIRKYRSWGPGLRCDKFASNMSELSGIEFKDKTIKGQEKPIDVLKDLVKNGKPVAIEYMTGTTTAHWVIVTDVKDTKEGPELTVQSWGRYYKVKFSEIDDAWKRGYGGPYPYVVADKAMPPRPAR